MTEHAAAENHLQFELLSGYWTAEESRQLRSGRVVKRRDLY